MRSTRIVPVVLVATLMSIAMSCRDVPLGPDPFSRVAPRGSLVQTAPVVASFPAGDVGGGPLTPGTTFPPTEGSLATLYRGDDCLHFTVETTGLPPGAYDVWLRVYNVPDRCSGPPFDGLEHCGQSDAPLFGDRLAESPSQVTEGWVDSRVVGLDGVGQFSGNRCRGETYGFPFFQHFFGPGILDTYGSEVFIALLYHGPASDDPDVLYWQLHGTAASCQKNANGVTYVDGIDGCSPLQIAYFTVPR